MKVKAIPIQIIEWIRRQGKNASHRSMGIRVAKVHGVTMDTILRDRGCMFPGCTHKLTHFEIGDGTDRLPHSRPTPYSMDQYGRKTRLTIDHKIAQCLGGKDTPDNKWLMCEPHNKEKSQHETYLYNVNRGVKP